MKGAALPESSRFWTGNVVRARCFDAISLLLPAGEAFVIQALQDAVATYPLTPEERSRIQHLIDEERSHQRAHDRYNARLAALGLPVPALAERVAALIEPLRRRPLAFRILRADSRVLEWPLTLAAAAVWVLGDIVRLLCALLAADRVQGQLSRRRICFDGARFLCAVLPSLARLPLRACSRLRLRSHAVLPQP